MGDVRTAEGEVGVDREGGGAGGLVAGDVLDEGGAGALDGDGAEADDVAHELTRGAEDVVLPEGGGDDGRALEAGVDVAPGLEVDVLDLLVAELLADEVDEAVLVVDVDGEVGEAGLGDEVGDGELGGDAGSPAGP